LLRMGRNRDHCGPTPASPARATTSSSSPRSSLKSSMSNGCRQACAYSGGVFVHINAERPGSGLGSAVASQQAHDRTEMAKLRLFRPIAAVGRACVLAASGRLAGGHDAQMANRLGQAHRAQVAQYDPGSVLRNAPGGWASNIKRLADRPTTFQMASRPVESLRWSNSRSGRRPEPCRGRSNALSAYGRKRRCRDRATHILGESSTRIRCAEIVRYHWPDRC